MMNNIIYIKNSYNIWAALQVEVVDLLLSQDERPLLYSSCSQYFNDDAWLAASHNIQHCSDMKGVILPVYKNADSTFWQLYATHLKHSVLMKRNIGSTIEGFWLDEAERHQYQLLKQLNTITRKNIIKGEHGPLYWAGQFSQWGWIIFWFAWAFQTQNSI